MFRQHVTWYANCSRNNAFDRVQLLKHVDDNKEAVMTNNNGIFLCACYKTVRIELCLRQHHRDMDKYAFIFNGHVLHCVAEKFLLWGRFEYVKLYKCHTRHK